MSQACDVWHTLRAEFKGMRIRIANAPPAIHGDGWNTQIAAGSDAVARTPR